MTFSINWRGRGSSFSPAVLAGGKGDESPLALATVMSVMEILEAIGVDNEVSVSASGHQGEGAASVSLSINRLMPVRETEH